MFSAGRMVIMQTQIQSGINAMREMVPPLFQIGHAASSHASGLASVAFALFAAERLFAAVEFVAVFSSFGGYGWNVAVAVICIGTLSKERATVGIGAPVSAPSIKRGWIDSPVIIRCSITIVLRVVTTAIVAIDLVGGLTVRKGQMEGDL